ncbi:MULTISPECIES: mevalonate kinase [unclassified Oceanispirochaeta]|uniref:mevalonate kinase n=1 Tax=unclassified Oceanispirochaeta TaxID=2635722 RepID=UPI000E08D93B|nr:MULTISPECIES: mevalonate kinase [unclassified Oceanispirochaeta]MBF9015731.1 mevalonate kinase [Oceanispirochaeta sp. M2]NPD72196.1 mevalonate kinase [Oceanispirochaeta sp. M1]RDG32295.1 mevalonate kinase [Oceanispirochaeta sp. M1]
MSTGKGFGKTILIGDQFVLWEVPAILAAIPFETECTVERLKTGSGWILDDKRIEVPGYKKAKEKDCRASFDRMVEVMELDLENNPIKISVEGDLLAGSGVGASAAICVSFARACNKEFALNMDILDINHVAWEGEFGYHGLPSGLDNTVSSYGGVIKYRIKDDVKQFERINLSKPIEIVLGNSGVTANTASLKGFLEEQEKEDSELFNGRLDTIKSQVEELGKALSRDDLKETGSIMNKNHKILIEMGLSHEKLIYLCDKAVSLGAYGAKVTGGGRGGYMVALTPGKELQEKVAAQFESEGIATIRATIGGTPTDETKFQILK